MRNVTLLPSHLISCHNIPSYLQYQSSVNRMTARVPTIQPGGIILFCYFNATTPLLMHITAVLSFLPLGTNIHWRRISIFKWGHKINFKSSPRRLIEFAQNLTLLVLVSRDEIKPVFIVEVLVLVYQTLLCVDINLWRKLCSRAPFYNRN